MQLVAYINFNCFKDEVWMTFSPHSLRFYFSCRHYCHVSALLPRQSTVLDIYLSPIVPTLALLPHNADL